MASGIRWTAEMFEDFKRRTERKPAVQEAPKPPPRQKYGSKKVQINGASFDSQKEARRWEMLVQMEKAGMISGLRRQVAFELAPAVMLDGDKKMKPTLRYFADAVYIQDGKLVVEDTKSAPTRKKDSYRIKKHLLATVLGLQIKEV